MNVNHSPLGRKVMYYVSSEFLFYFVFKLINADLKKCGITKILTLEVYWKILRKHVLSYG